MFKISRISFGYLYLKFNQIIEEIKIYLVKIARQFYRPNFPKTEDSKIYLHLGCGSVNHPKFINIDARPAPHIHYIRAIDNLSLFADESVDLIYACHCLEHFPHNQISRILSEWYRVLKHGGILRLSVPDFDLLLKIYYDLNQSLEPIQGMLMGGQDYAFNFHKSVFNSSSLEKELHKVGFTEVRRWEPNQCEMTTMGDWSGRLLGGKYHVSLNLEAVKSLN